MEEKEARAFYPTWFLLTTGFCFLLFTLLLNIVDGVNVQLFGWIGLVSFVAGIVTGAGTWAGQVRRRKAK